MRLRSTAFALLSVIALTGLPVKADFTPIATPTAAYTSSTDLIDISSIPDFTTGITSVTDGTQTVSFDVALEKRTVGSSWSTWNNPPFVESSNPPVLFRTDGNSLTMTLSVLSTTFGFELEGNSFGAAEYRVTFYEGAVAVGSITETIIGQAGAKLIDAYSTDEFFTSVRIDNIDGLANGFAIAQVRYAVPEPASVIMIVQAIGAVGFYGWRKRRQAAQSV